MTAAVFGVQKNGVPAISENYFRHIRACGVGTLAIANDNITGSAAACDCLVVCGGGDMHPRFYGEQPWREGLVFDTAFDEMELSVIRSFLLKKKPILGICRGMQSINVACGGTLYRDLPSMCQTNHSETTHIVTVDRSSRLYSALGGKARVNSFHHQSVKRLGQGLRAAATAPDGIVEAIEGESLPLLGVQWHPERMEGNALFEHFFSTYF